MPSASHKASRRDDSNKSTIEMELEELIASEPSESVEVFGSEVLKDAAKSPRSRKSKSKKIQYTKRTDDSKDTNDDAQSKKSARSRRSKLSRTSARVRKMSVDRAVKNDDIGSRSPKLTRSPNLDRNTKERRRIKYRSQEPETPEERERDTRSYRSKDSKASGNLRRSGHRKIKADDERDGVSSRDGSNKGIKKKSQRSRSSSMNQEIPKQKSWSSFDDFDSNEWSSSSSEEDEGDVEIRLNDEGAKSFRSTGSNGERKSRSRHNVSRQNSLVDRQKGAQAGSMQRSSSGGGLEASSRRRHARRRSNGSMDVGMVLGDPSRRAPPTRTKSIDRSAPTRKNSGNFADYLSKQGLTHRSDRSTSRTQYSDPSSLDSTVQDDNDNPFEVIHHQSFALPDNWDPFASDAAGETDLDGTSSDPRGNLRRSRSGGLLQLSSKDTISRLPAGANVRKTFNDSNAAAMSNVITDINELGDREKQRRADYKKSIAAAAMAGRRLASKTASKPTRQTRTTIRSSSYGESLGQLEGALQSAQ